MSGVLTLMASMNGSYKKPVLRRIDTKAIIGTDTAYGYVVSPAPNASPSLYLDRPMVSGKWYWEVPFQTQFILPGLTNELVHYDYGGWNNSKGSQLYSNGWSSRNWGVAEETLTPTPSNTSVIGCLFDADEKVMEYRTNSNAPSVVHRLTTQSGPFYALFGGQGGACQFRLGMDGCVYSPPAGYAYL